MDLSDAARLGDWSAWLVVVGGAVAVLLGFFRWVWPRWKAFRNKVGGIFDVILGSEAIVSRVTGKELVPAQEGIGVRQARSEQQMELLTVTVTKLVDQQDYLQALSRVVDGHHDRLTALEEAAVERVVTKAESTAGWRAMEAAIKATPDIDAEAADE